ncbi:MAG: hypothetical protein IJJ76_07955 [Ruminococcus sp.]|uniref:hypothetical protein n=1 Tax=Ruminococcus sp. TaxID=41978 RepID=UPI0025EDD5E2|nr:hypothetical protein [Ruminococcus sp.]MBR0529679.1 hypothetical protein [Ruminococcus sp.]
MTKRQLCPKMSVRIIVELKVDDRKLAMPEFKSLWEKINSKSVYVVDFETEELIKNTINVLNGKLRVQKILSVS